MTARFVMIHNLVNPATGKTRKQENMELHHAIPVGSLVEVRFDRWYGEGACMKAHARLWVVSHDRDCDGTPLYTLSRWNDPPFALSTRDYQNGFGEESLTPMELMPELIDGKDALEWSDDG